MKKYLLKSQWQNGIFIIKSLFYKIISKKCPTLYYKLNSKKICTKVYLRLAIKNYKFIT